MRFRLEAAPGELLEKGTRLVEELAKALSSVQPDLAETLEKALPPKEQGLKYPAMRQLKDLTTKKYEAMLKLMLVEVGKVLDKSLEAPTIQKSLEGVGRSVLAELGMTLGDWEQLQSPELVKAGFGPPEKDPDAEPDEPEEAEEPLEPGDYNPKTDEVEPEPEEEPEEPEEEEEGEKKSLKKALITETELREIAKKYADRIRQAALSPQSKPLTYDHTKPIAEKDDRAYARVKQVLIGRGYAPTDFEIGGKLYGQSVNELIDLVRQERKRQRSGGNA